MKRALVAYAACFFALLIAGGGQGAGSHIADFRQNGNRIVAFGAVGAALLGTDLALSADGNTAFVSGFYDDGKKGAAWTFVRSGGAWSQSGGKVTSGANNPAQFGWSVALSADGTTALVGGNEYGVAKGAAWVYTRSGSSWTAQAKLLPNDKAGAGRFGRASRCRRTATSRSWAAAPTTGRGRTPSTGRLGSSGVSARRGRNSGRS